MLKVVSILSTIVLVSLYYFPIRFMFMPEINTKLVLGVIGLICFGIDISKNRRPLIGKDYISLTLAAGIFSLLCYGSVILNGTSDHAYSTYLISMFVWLFAAYTACKTIKAVHHQLSIPLLTHYLLIICVVQCALALTMDYYHPLRNFVDSIIYQDQDFLHELKRIYGIGAALDTAGIRFSVVLLLTAHLLQCSTNTRLEKYKIFYIIGFITITIVGCMIARTTIVGSAIGIAYLIIVQIQNKQKKAFDTKAFIGIIIVLCLALTITAYFYNSNPVFHQQIRFAFEGFFSLAEEGEWEVSSTNRLKTMIVFPETLKTWLIGDGYFSNPIATDPYFTGEFIGGYYMGTDIGYLRFIFYCGLIGLAAFSYFICLTARVCMKNFPDKKLLILLLLAVNFIIWMKVSTDVFLIFAMLLWIEPKEDKDYEEKIQLEK